LRRPSFCETDNEEAEEISIGGFDISVGFDESLPFADEGAELVRGEVHAMEVGQTVLALNLVDTQLDFAEGLFLVVIKVS